MAVLLSHFTVSALPRAFARVASHVHCSLFSLSSVCHHRHLHYPHHTMNFSSIGDGYPIGIRNFSSANYLEEESTGAAETIRSPDLVAMEYAELNLPHICQEVGHVRIRQHVNPLSSAFSVPAEPPDWNVVFKDPLLPLVVDIGCGSGRFLLWLAKRNSDSKNYLGLEIRKKVWE